MAIMLSETQKKWIEDRLAKAVVAYPLAEVMELMSLAYHEGFVDGTKWVPAPDLDELDLDGMPPLGVL